MNQHNKTFLPSRVALIALLSLAAILRLYGLESRSLWLDEYTSIEVASKTLGQILTAAGFNSHTPPFYYALLHIWLKFFPANEWGIRSLSVVADLFSISAVVLIFSRQFSSRIGLALAFLLSVSPYSVNYGQEGRMYALTMLLVLLSYYYLLKLPTGTWSWGERIGLFLVSVAGMYTHYYFALSLFSLVVAFTVVLRKQLTKLLQLYGLMFLVALAFLPWLGVIAGLLGGEGQDFRRFVFSVLPYTLFRFAAGYAVMPLNYGAKEAVVETLQANSAAVAIYGATFIILSVIGLSELLKRYREQAIIILSALLLPALLALAISFYTPMLSERYLIVCYPFFLCLTALSWQSEKWGEFCCICSVILFGFALLQHYKNPDFGNTQWREATAVMATKESNCQNVAVNPDYLQGLVNHYLGPGWNLSPVNDSQQLTVLLDQIRNSPCPGYWLIERGTATSLVSAGISSGRVRGVEIVLEHDEFFHLENGIRLSYLAIK